MCQHFYLTDFNWKIWYGWYGAWRLRWKGRVRPPEAWACFEHAKQQNKKLDNSNWATNEWKWFVCMGRLHASISTMLASLITSKQNLTRKNLYNTQYFDPYNRL